MKFILARKLGMSQAFDASGRLHALTLLEAGPVQVIRIKTPERDGYRAVQLGFGKKKGKAFRWVREFRPRRGEELPAPGASLTVSMFSHGDVVDVIGTSKGRGFQGVVKRHGFGGHPASHGTKHAHREPGSIGPTHPQHVVKGRRMAGHMGARRVTIKNLKVFDVNPEKNLLMLEGAVPGSRGSLVIVRGRDER
jgi:large subunit ribosomal protein L3